MIGPLVRRLGFVTLDRLLGGDVMRHYKDIASNIEGQGESIDRLSNILRYAIKHVPYYRDINTSCLSCFPVVNKSVIMSNYDAFRSVEYRNDDALHWVSTSGSTGIPFRASQNRDKRKRTIADLMYFHRINGWNIGDRYVFLRAWTSGYSLTKWKLWKQNFVAVDVVNFDRTAKEKLRQRLIADKEIKVILGYASAMQDFVTFLEEKGDHADMFGIKVIFTDSDNLSDRTKSRLKQMFRCPVINRYSNEEHGLLACTIGDSNEFTLNTASYYFELLALDGDRPVQPGETGRLVVTDLYNL